MGALAAMVVVGTIDSVLYIRLANKMEPYEWYLSQIMITLAFCVISWPVVWYRMWSGTVTPEMRSFPLMAFLWIGFLDAVGNLLGTIPAPYVPGPFISVFGKSVIPLTMILSMVVLGVRYRATHVLGALIIVGAVILNLVPFIQGESSSNQLFWGTFVMVATVPAAVSNVFKERGLKVADLDVWYFNAWVAIFQLGWGLSMAWSVFVPLPDPAQHVSVREFPAYMVNATACFAGMDTGETEGNVCDFTWAIFAVFIAFNVIANVLMLWIFQRGSAVLAIIAGTAKLVLINLAFHIPLVAGEALVTKFSLYNLAALGIIIVGILVYRMRKEIRPASSFEERVNTSTQVEELKFVIENEESEESDEEPLERDPRGRNAYGCEDADIEMVEMGKKED
jgi:hypothetical protein